MFAPPAIFCVHAPLGAAELNEGFDEGRNGGVGELCWKRLVWSDGGVWKHNVSQAPTHFRRIMHYHMHIHDPPLVTNSTDSLSAFIYAMFTRTSSSAAFEAVSNISGGALVFIGQLYSASLWRVSGILTWGAAVVHN